VEANQAAAVRWADFVRKANALKTVIHAINLTTKNA
jgi:hypothetical protein